MSAAIAFDTRRFPERLAEHGFTEAQAEALANAQVGLLDGNPATRVDVAAIQRGIKALRQKTRAGIEVLRQGTRADVANLEADLLK